MVRTYKDMAGYQRYIAPNVETNRPQRDDAVMPYLQYNEDGQPILMPGEVFCRYRDDGVLCMRVNAYSSPSALRKHYQDCHETNPECRRSGSNGTSYQEDLNRWYLAVMNGEMPRWVPRKAADDTISILSDLLSDIDMEDEEEDEEEEEEDEDVPDAPETAPETGPEVITISSGSERSWSGISDNSGEDQLPPPIWRDESRGVMAIAEMRRAVGLTPYSVKCPACDEHNRQCPPRRANSDCLVWENFQNPYNSQ